MATARTRANGAPNDRLMQQVAQIQKDIAELGDVLSQIAVDKAEAVQDGSRQALNDALGAGEAAGKDAIARLRAAEQDFDRLVTQRPLASMAVAAGVGYLIGLFSSRK